MTLVLESPKQRTESSEPWCHLFGKSWRAACTQGTSVTGRPRAPWSPGDRDGERLPGEGVGSGVAPPTGTALLRRGGRAERCGHVRGSSSPPTGGPFSSGCLPVFRRWGFQGQSHGRVSVGYWSALQLWPSRGVVPPDGPVAPGARGGVNPQGPDISQGLPPPP